MHRTLQSILVELLKALITAKRTSCETGLISFGQFYHGKRYHRESISNLIFDVQETAKIAFANIVAHF